MAMLTTDEVIAGLEKQIRRKEREIAYTKKWILKLREPTLSIRCGWRRDGICHCQEMDYYKYMCPFQFLHQCPVHNEELTTSEETPGCGNE